MDKPLLHVYYYLICYKKRILGRKTKNGFMFPFSIVQQSNSDPKKALSNDFGISSSGVQIDKVGEAIWKWNNKNELVLPDDKKLYNGYSGKSCHIYMVSMREQLKPPPNKNKWMQVIKAKEANMEYSHNPVSDVLNGFLVILAHQMFK